MAKKVKLDKDENGVKYKFPERTCKGCTKYPCFQNMEICKCDFAKYGCSEFKSDGKS